MIVEHFTNSRCGTCAARNPAFYETLEDYPEVIHIAYHPSSPYSSCIFSQHNPEENDDRTNFYGIYGGTPRAVIQGNVVPVQNPLVEPEQIDIHLGKNSDYSLTLNKELTGGDEYKVSLTIERVSGSGSEELMLYAGLAEKEVQYAAPNGEDIHPNVFRKVLNQTSINIMPGESQTLTETYVTDDEWIEEEIYAFAILQDEETNMIMQSATSLDSPASVTERSTGELGSVFFPNPARQHTSVLPPYRGRFITAELYTLTGNKVRTYQQPEKIDLQDQLPGLYLMVLTDGKGRKYTTRLVKTL
ncbi:MAG: T9SS type A sorting domain-containing protein [bacterium]